VTPQEMRRSLDALTGGDRQAAIVRHLGTALTVLNGDAYVRDLPPAVAEAARWAVEKSCNNAGTLYVCQQEEHDYGEVGSGGEW
jgi:hypothetical protein